MALKRFSGNPTYTRSTVDSADIIPFTHSPTADDNEDGKITFDELSHFMQENDTTFTKFSVVSEIPEASSANYRILYLVKDSESAADIYHGYYKISDTEIGQITGKNYTGDSGITVNAETHKISNDLVTKGGTINGNLNVTGEYKKNGETLDFDAVIETTSVPSSPEQKIYNVTEDDDTSVYSKDIQLAKESEITDIEENYARKDGTTFSGEVTVNNTLNINGTIYQNGEAYETHAEKLYTKDDLIITRDGAETGLAENEYTGIEAELYDGTNNGRLVFDNTGTARVGDTGDEQALATRDEDSEMTDGASLYWDGTEKCIKTMTGKTAVVDTKIITEDTTESSVSNDTRYLITGGNLTIGSAETGVIITVYSSAGTTLTINSASVTLSENEVKQYIYKNQWYEISGGSDMSSESYTFTVDSDDKLKQWFENDTSDGQDYSFVYIAKGTWNYTISDLSSTEYTLCNISATQKVQGNKDSKIVVSGSFASTNSITVNVFKGTYGAGHDATNDDYDLGYMQDVTVNVSLYHTVLTDDYEIRCNVFSNITNLTHCIVADSWVQSVDPIFNGFNKCKNLLNCYANDIETNIYIYDTNEQGAYVSIYGFNECYNVEKCRASDFNVITSQSFSDYNDSGAVSGYTFYNCYWTTKCLTYSTDKTKYISSAPAAGTKYSTSGGISYSSAPVDTAKTCYSTSPSAKVAIAYTEAGGYNIVSDIANSAILIPDSIW